MILTVSYRPVILAPDEEPIMRKIFPFKFSSWLAALVVLAIILPASLAAADDNDGSEIIFLHLRIDAGGVSLVDARTVPGHLKTPRTDQPRGELVYELVAGESEVLYTAGINDPLTLKFDYEDPDQPGRLKSKVVQLNETEFTVRVPAVAGATSVNFYRVERTTGASTRSAARQLIGSIPVNSGEEVER
jgi:hypothetical protein